MILNQCPLSQLWLLLSTICWSSWRHTWCLITTSLKFCHLTRTSQKTFIILFVFFFLLLFQTLLLFIILGIPDSLFRNLSGMYIMPFTYCPYFIIIKIIFIIDFVIKITTFYYINLFKFFLFF